jgi:hypothetical protein
MNKMQEFQILNSLWELETYETEINNLVCKHLLFSVAEFLQRFHLVSAHLLCTFCFVENGIVAIAGNVPTTPTNVADWPVRPKKNIPKQEDGYVKQLLMLILGAHYSSLICIFSMQ